MPTIEQQLADAIAAQNALTQAVATYKSQIESTVASQKSIFDAWKAGVQREYPMPPNMVKNPYMSAVTNGIPDGYSSSGVAISAVHPYTKAFEGPYAQSAPAGSVSNPNLATETTPYWFGSFIKGVRFPVFSGGLADGWGALNGGKILKITGTATNAIDNRQVFLPLQRRAYVNRVGFRAWVHIAQGSEIQFGDNAGWQGQRGGLQISKADIDKSPERWMFVDFKLDIAASMGPVGNAFPIGFSSKEDVEVYLAMPYLYSFLNPATPGLSIGE